MIPLSCAGCGANLEIEMAMDILTCSYCGTQQKLVKKGGTVYLALITDAIKYVQLGTDRTASELSLVRLRKELPIAINEQAAANAELKELNDQLPWENPKYKSNAIWALICLFVPLFFYREGNGWFIAIACIGGFLYFISKASKLLPEKKITESPRLKAAIENVLRINDQIAAHEKVVNKPL